MEGFTSNHAIIGISLIIILSFLFNNIAKKTNIPAVLMLIVLGVIVQYGLRFFNVADTLDFFPALEILGKVGLIMIVLEAALELKLEREKLIPILKSLAIAFIGLIVSTYAAALLLNFFIDGMSMMSAWLYATPLSILSSAIIIPSVSGLSELKKEFHVYESTFSDILGIMLFYFLKGELDPEGNSGIVGFGINFILTIIVSFVLSYAMILIFQKIKSQVKLFLLIAVLLLLYAIGKEVHMSSLIIILIFGLVIANMKLFFKGKIEHFLDYEKAKAIYHELHIITAETAFVVRTLFFVIFGITIVLSSLLSFKVTIISSLIMVSIYIIRLVLLRIFLGKDINPQVFIAPRGLITVLLFYTIPEEAIIPGFEPGILLFVIIGTSLIMTGGMILNSKKSNAVIPIPPIPEEDDSFDKKLENEHVEEQVLIIEEEEVDSLPNEETFLDEEEDMI